jgi:hypothetical protein
LRDLVCLFLGLSLDGLLNERLAKELGSLLPDAVPEATVFGAAFFEFFKSLDALVKPFKHRDVFWDLRSACLLLQPQRFTV